MKILTMGPNGAGKGTQSKLMKERLGIPDISTGAVVKGEYPKYRHLTAQFKQYFEAGGLVPDEFMNDVARQLIEGLDDFNLDGFPRTLGQVKYLDDITEIDAVFYMNLPREVAMEHATNRLICVNKDCNEIYGLERKPNEDGTCIVCYRPTEKRPDDTPEKAKRRYENFLDTTYPVLELYDSRSKLVNIDATGSPEEVFARINLEVGYLRPLHSFSWL